MFGQGLSLDQAPPFSAPFRFFITAPFFGMIAGIVLIIIGGEALSDAHMLPFLGVVHLITLGVVSMVMMGAMQQMLPVIAGVQFRSPLRNAGVMHGGMVLGTPLFSSGFLLGESSLLVVGSVLVMATLLFFAGVTIAGLFGTANRSASVRAFTLAILSLIIAVGLGTAAGFAYSGVAVPAGVAALHINWIVFGWIMLLVIGVSFQVVPMFYVTDAYPPFCRKYGVGIIFALLLLASWVILGPGYAAWVVPLAQGGIVLLVSGYGVITILRLRRRKRAVADSNVLFWYLAMGSLVSGVTGWFAGYYIVPDETLLLCSGIVFGVGFLLSLITAMLYKIVPFLVWFHLTNMGYFPVPTMRELIGEKGVRRHLYLHIASLTAFLAAASIDGRLYGMAGLLFLLENGLFFYHLYAAGRVYFKKIREPRPRMDFDMGSFTKND